MSSLAATNSISNPWITSGLIKSISTYDDLYSTLACNSACKIIMKGIYFNEFIKSELRKSLFTLQSRDHDTECYPSNITFSEIILFHKYLILHKQPTQVVKYSTGHHSGYTTFYPTFYPHPYTLRLFNPSLFTPTTFYPLSLFTPCLKTKVLEQNNIVQYYKLNTFKL